MIALARYGKLGRPDTVRKLAVVTCGTEFCMTW